MKKKLERSRLELALVLNIINLNQQRLNAELEILCNLFFKTVIYASQM